MFNVFLYTIAIALGKFSAKETGADAANVRLKGSRYQNQGRVELLLHGKWAKICAKEWTIEEAKVVCHELGLPMATRAFGGQIFEPGIVQYKASEFKCVGTEPSIVNCTFTEYSYCSIRKEANVVCGGQKDEVFLVDGLTPNQGRVEVFYKGKRGLVCDKDWDLNDAKVVCSMLGLPVATHAVKQSFFGFVLFLRPDLMTQVGCQGNETSLFNCSFSDKDLSGCDNAGVVCGQLSAKFKLVGGKSHNEGRVLVAFGRTHTSFRKEWTILCDPNWNIQEARVICRSLGYQDAMFAVHPDMFEDNHDGMFFLLKNLRCYGNESSIAHCFYEELKEHSLCRMVGVICGSKNSTVTVRLAGSSIPGSGRVELNVGGHWGSVCHNKWLLSNARVVCRSLGYSNAYYSTAGSMFGGGDNGRLVLDNVHCLGNESSILHCKHSGIGSASCTIKDTAGVICDKPQIQFQLTGNGATANQGRILISVGGVNGTVCTKDTWDNTDARVLCKSLGLGDEGYAVKNLAFGKGTGPTLLMNVNCHGNETNLMECGHNTLGFYGACTHENAAGIICSKIHVRLVGGPCWNHGQIEMQIDGHWGLVSQSYLASEQFCRMLGFPGQGLPVTEPVYATSNKTVLVSNIDCFGKSIQSTSSVLDCPFKYRTKTGSFTTRVTCGPPTERLKIVNITSSGHVIFANQSELAIDNDLNTCLFLPVKNRMTLIFYLNTVTYIHAVALVIRNSIYSSLEVIIKPLDKYLRHVICTPSSKFIAKEGMTYDCSPPTRASHVIVRMKSTIHAFGLCNINIFGFGSINDARGALHESWSRSRIYREKGQLLRLNPYFAVKPSEVYTTKEFKIDSLQTNKGIYEGQRISMFFKLPEHIKANRFHASCDYECEFWGNEVKEEGIDTSGRIHSPQLIIKSIFKTDRNDFNKHPQQKSAVRLSHCYMYYAEGYLKTSNRRGMHLLVKMNTVPSNELIFIPKNMIFWNLPGKRTFDFVLTNTKKGIINMEYLHNATLTGNYSFCCHGIFCPSCPIYSAIMISGVKLLNGPINMDCVAHTFTKQLVGSSSLQPGFYGIRLEFGYIKETLHTSFRRNIGNLVVKVPTLLQCSFQINICPGWNIKSTLSRSSWILHGSGSMLFNSTGISTLTSPLVNIQRSINEKKELKKIKFCLTFDYKMSSNTSGSLGVFIYHKGLPETIIWLLRGYHGNIWNLARVPFEDIMEFQAAFVGNSSQNNSELFLRNVNIEIKTCYIQPEIAKPGYECGQGRLKCFNGNCYDYSLRCNGKKDGCIDGSDEEGCRCQADDLQCPDGNCVPTSKLCDGKKDCANGMDEKHCDTTSKCEFLCPDGHCTTKSRICFSIGQSSDHCIVPKIECDMTKIESNYNKNCSGPYGKCNFESSACSFEPENSTSSIWRRKVARLSKLTEDHTTLSSNGHYMYFRDSSKSSSKERILRYKTFNKTNCFQFWYFIHGSASLNIYAIAQSEEFLLWNHTGNTGEYWTFGQTPISHKVDGYYVAIEGVSRNTRSYIAVDDINFVENGCPTIIHKDSPNCDFIQNKCSWTGHKNWITDNIYSTSAGSRGLMVFKGSKSYRNISSPLFNPRVDGWKCVSFWFLSTAKYFERQFTVSLTNKHEETIKVLWTYKSITNNPRYIQLPFPEIDDDVKLTFTIKKEQEQLNIFVKNLLFLKEKCQEVVPISECHDYQTLTDLDRRVENKVITDKMDDLDSTIWYRFDEPAGNQIPTFCVGEKHCGVQNPLWVDGILPLVKHQLTFPSYCKVERQCCSTRGGVYIRHCGDFYVYKNIQSYRKSSQICSTYKEVVPVYDKRKEWQKWTNGNNTGKWEKINTHIEEKKSIHMESDLKEVHFSHNSIVQIPDGSPIIDALTVCLWINALNLNGSSFQLLYFNYSVNKERLFYLNLTNGYIEVMIGGETRSINTTVFDGKWHHVCFTWKSFWGVWYLFIDGVIIRNGMKLGDLYRIIGKGIQIMQLNADGTNNSKNQSSVFIAKLTNVNIWKEVFSGEDIVQMSYGCSLDLHDKRVTLLSWSLLQTIAPSASLERTPATCLGTDAFTRVLKSNNASETLGISYSPWYNRSSESNKQCLRFRYKFYDTNRAKLSIHQDLEFPSLKEVPLWVQTGNKSLDIWNFAQVWITTTSAYRIIIKGHIGERGYIAIGGLQVINSPNCAKIPASEPVNHIEKGTTDGCFTPTYLTNPAGEITSLNYPAPYEENTTNCWNIQVKKGHIIRLLFKAFDLPFSKSCSKSSLTFYDSDEVAWFGRYCGSSYPNFIDSSSNVLRIVFKLAKGSYHGGFKITYSSIFENRKRNCIPDCPPSCRCYRQESQIVVHGKHLYSIPQPLPLKTTVINFEEGHIFEIKDDDLFNLVSLKYLNLAHNKLLRVQGRALVSNKDIEFLKLGRNFLKELKPSPFVNLDKLSLLELQKNFLKNIDKSTLKGLPNLEYLFLQENVIESLHKFALMGNRNLKQIYLQYNRISNIPTRFFQNQNQLRILNISNNEITRIDQHTFEGLTSLEELYLHENYIVERDVDQHAFKPLISLRFLKVDSFVVCCYAKQFNPDLKCESAYNKVSSCKNLLKNSSLRVCIWILGLLALLGNIWVIFYWSRLANIDQGDRGKKSRVQSFLLTNLAVSDLLMGIYLIMIASHDIKWKGNYFEHDVAWRGSWTCNLAGGLSMLASEASVLILTTITADRLNSIVFHIKARPFTMTAARVVCCVIWLTAILMSFLPIFVFYDKKQQMSFYGRSSVCLPLQLSNLKPSGWEYAVGIYIAFNGCAFLFILVSYLAIFVKVRISSKSVRSNIKKDSGLAFRVALIILTDFFCWIPVVIIGCLSLTPQGFEDPEGQAYAWIAVFVLPINSSINPILYTFSNPQFRKIFTKLCKHKDDKDNHNQMGMTLQKTQHSPLQNHSVTTHTILGTPKNSRYQEKENTHYDTKL